MSIPRQKANQRSNSIKKIVSRGLGPARIATTTETLPSPLPSGGSPYSKPKPIRSSSAPLPPVRSKAITASSKLRTEQRSNKKYPDTTQATTRSGVFSSLHFPKSNNASSGLITAHSPRFLGCNTHLWGNGTQSVSYNATFNVISAIRYWRQSQQDNPKFTVGFSLPQQPSNT